MTAAQVAAAIAGEKQVAALEVVLEDGVVEKVALQRGRYRAATAAATVLALDGGVALRLLARDGAVLRVLRLKEQAPAPAAPAQPESEGDRALRIVGEIAQRAHEQAAAVSATVLEATRAERELAWRGMGKALEVLTLMVERVVAQMGELHERERETSAREADAAAAAAAAEGGTPGASVAAVLRELPAAAPALAAAMGALRSQ